MYEEVLNFFFYFYELYFYKLLSKVNHAYHLQEDEPPILSKMPRHPLSTCMTVFRTLQSLKVSASSSAIFRLNKN